MLFIFTLLIFMGSALVTSGLVHEPRRWRVAMGLTTIVALWLAIWTAELFDRLIDAMAGGKSTALPAVLAALPYAAILLRLTMVRVRTPQHEPRPEDDPTIRRYLQEKVRRGRKRRQDEEALEHRDDSMGPETGRS